MGRRKSLVAAGLLLFIGTGVGSAEAAEPYGPQSGPPSPITNPGRVAAGPDGHLLVPDRGGRIHELRQDGTRVRTLTPPASAEISYVSSVGTAPDGEIVGAGNYVHAYRVNGSFKRGYAAELCPVPGVGLSDWSGVVVTDDWVATGGNCNQGPSWTRDLERGGLSVTGRGCFQRTGDLLISHFQYSSRSNFEVRAQRLPGGEPVPAPFGGGELNGCITVGPDGRAYGSSVGSPSGVGYEVRGPDDTPLGYLDPAINRIDLVIGDRGYSGSYGAADHILSFSVVPGTPADFRELGNGPGTPDPEPTPAPTATPTPAPTPETDACGTVFRAPATGGTLNGTDGRDHLVGSAVADLLNGLEGDDCLRGFAGNDRIYGQGGNDLVDAGDGDDYLHGMNGSDDLHGDAGNDELYGGLGHDDVDGGPGDDVAHGQEGDDLVRGRTGDDELYGEIGNDRFIAGEGDDLVHGQDGDDTVFADAGDDVVYGETGNDQIEGLTENDILYGQEGDDVLAGGQGRDDLDGEGGADTLSGGTEADRLKGGAGRDRLSGGAGDDVIDAADGERDVVDCGPGTDRVIADALDELTHCETVTRTRAARIALSCPRTAKLGCEGTLVVRGVDRARFALSPGSRQVIVAAARNVRTARKARVTVRVAPRSTRASAKAKRVTIR